MQIRRPLALVAACVLLCFTAACSSEPPLDLSPEAAAGRDIANSKGCASCHGKNGQGVTGPSLQGIYLAQIPLEGGGTVLADDEYLARSMTDPQADIVRGWTLKMPRTELDDSEVAAIITYIKELT